MNDYGHYCRPGLVELLEALTLDAAYERAEGDYLWQRRGDRLVEVLDLLGGFGANLFGHYHPALVAEEQRLTQEKVPLLAQGSCRPGAAALAKALCQRLGDYIVIFTNSGTETVEAALKHVYLERKRSVFWAVKNAFHGKTLGAIQLTENYREPFSPWSPQVRFLDPEAPSTWGAAEAEATEVAAAYLEPVQGEGGIKPLGQPFVQWLTQVCRRYEIPVVVDEIQTGLGRTGTFLASEWLGIQPDYLCLGKALGGGLAKIGALLIKRERFVSAFSIKHTSTFAEDDRGCYLALKALEVLDRDDIPGRCAALGQYLLEKLEPLRQRFPNQIKEVRGKGLMVGIELQDLSDSPSNALRMLSRQEFLCYLAAAYLLNVHQIRVGPALSQPFTIRIEPSAYISKTDLDRFVRAFSTFCEALEATDLAHLTSFQIGAPCGQIVQYPASRPFKREPPRTARRVAFLGHLLLPAHAHDWDASLGGIPPPALEAYMAKPSRILGPTVFDQLHVRSRTGAEVHLSYIALDLTPKQILEAMKARETRWIMDKIEDAVALARDQQCSVMGLGAYTSIISGNCMRIRNNSIALTSGNSLTVGMGLVAVKRAAQKLGIEPSQRPMGIVAATGNIAATYALMMAPQVAELFLVVRDTKSPRLRALVEDIKTAAPSTPITVTEDLQCLRSCPLIVTASNAPEPLIHPNHLPAGRAIICDISLPYDVSPEVAQARPDVLVIRGGLVRLPCNEDFRIAGLLLETGHVYACMAETLLMGLEGVESHGSFGPVKPEGVNHMLTTAAKHGFELGDFLTGWPY